MVGTGIFGGSSGELFNLLWGWMDVVLLKVSFDSDGELGFGNLTVIVGVDLMEDCIGLIHVDAWCSF
jgi:hypothetical protein|tara:strand:+ start:35 stop:235 length:201 start_codon:yes stop_codon:yes gene_type:complete